VCSSDLGRVPPGLDFTDWLERLLHARGTGAEFDELAAQSAREGVKASLRCGVTTVGDITRRPDVVRAELKHGPLRVVSFGEVIAIGRGRDRLGARLDAALDRRHASPSLSIGVSPHAPYSIEPEGIKACADAVARHDLRLCMHLAETREEIRFLQYGDGPLREFLNRLDVLDERYECPGKRPLELAHDGGVLSPRTVLAHGNYVEDDELPLLAESGVHVAYCPRTHAAFGHEPHPYGRMLAAGINVCLGSDSLASNPSLSVLEEIRHLYQNDMGIEAVTLIAMATARGAAALGVAERTGSLEAGKDADLTVVPLDLRGPTDPLENILGSTLQPVATFVRGRRVA